MKLILTESVYHSLDFIVDIPNEILSNVSNPLYIGVRLGQVERVRKRFKLKNQGRAIGFWDLYKLGYITSNGKPTDKCLRHDAIIGGSIDRVPDLLKSLYEKLLWRLKTL
jgi:hypothetical protein